MSEHQYVAFRAVDGPVSEENLQFMRRQSTRAEITPWTFDNEYHWGDFRGNAAEMLRRGYDFHLHYANFGIRKILIRLPCGFPDPAAAKAYWIDHGVEFSRDKQAGGGILEISPFYEPGELEDVYEIEEMVERLMGLRAEIMAGDLRPLYLAHLAAARDQNHNPDTKEAPVPAGLKSLSKSQQALAEFYDISPSLIAAAAQGAPPLPDRPQREHDFAHWIGRQKVADKDRWLATWMADPHSSARRELMQAYQSDNQEPCWPTIELGRMISDLETAAEKIEQEAELKKAAARARTKRLQQMAANPLPTLRETEKLVEERTGHAYARIAQHLAELREALANSPQASLAEDHARKLKQKHPTLKLLSSELKKKGLLGK